MILINATIKYKGYDPNSLKPNSHKRICCSCDKCGRVRWLQKSKYLKLCSSCSRKGNRAPAWKGGLVTKVCKECGDKYKIIKQRKLISNFCSNKCKGKWMAKNRKGKNNSNWCGGTDKYQSYLVRINQCTKLNQRFPGSEGHHINKNTVIFIPKELHVHIRHNMKTGKNMNIINTLALQFINGEL